MQIKWLLNLILILSTCLVFGQADSSIANGRNSLKFDLFSPVSGCLGFSFEAPRQRSHSFDVEAGFIGIRIGDYFNYDKFLGGYISGGMRFYFENNNNIGQFEYINFNGIYIKPEITTTYFTYFNHTRKDIEGENLSLALLMCLGNQWIVADILVFDIWAGLGYDKSWQKETYNNLPVEEVDPYDYKFNYFHLSGSPVVFDLGISVGIFLK